MSLSGMNELLEFSIIDYVKDDCGGVEEKITKVFELFGKVALTCITSQNRNVYEIKIKHAKFLENLSNKKVLIKNGSRELLAEKIVANNKLTIIQCHDYKASANDI